MGAIFEGVTCHTGLGLLPVPVCLLCCEGSLIVRHKMRGCFLNGCVGCVGPAGAPVLPLLRSFSDNRPFPNFALLCPDR